MKNHPWFILGLAGSALLLVGCDQHADAESGHTHAEHGEHAEVDDDHAEAGVTFQAGRGLRLTPEVIQALGLRTVVATVQPFAAEGSVTARVFALQPQVHALASVTPTQADSFAHVTYPAAQLLRIDRSPAAATGLVDLVFALDSATPRAIGDFVTIAFTSPVTHALTVPRSAVLDGATGTFVYVAEQGTYQRLPVTIGAQSADLVEITGGLNAGTVVVAAPVEQLWLAELRLTKGGGHSH